MTSPNPSVGRDSVRDEHEPHSPFGTTAATAGTTASAPFTQSWRPGTHTIRTYQ